MEGNAWGLGLFQSDHDYDIIRLLSQDAALWNLEEHDAQERGGYPVFVSKIYQVGNKQSDISSLRDLEHAAAVSTTPKNIGQAVHYSVYAGLCSHPERVRRFLEDSPLLPRLLSMHVKKAREDKEDPEDPYYPHRPGYVCVLLCACLMSTGCKIPDIVIDFLKATYTHNTRVGLMREALEQMRDALLGDARYVPGTPYDFGSAGLFAVERSGGVLLGDRYLPTIACVPSPSGIVPKEVLTAAKRSGVFASFNHIEESLRPRYEAAKAKGIDNFGNQVCGSCGISKRDDGSSLTRCGKCNRRRYCDQGCQKAEWAEHRMLCKALPTAETAP